MKRERISKAAILAAGRDILAREGSGGLNIRTLASDCEISVGTIYNYFHSKDDLLIETFISIWGEILKNPEAALAARPFPEAVRTLFRKLHKGRKRYPYFVQGHALSLGGAHKAKAREAMQQYFAGIKSSLLESLNRDQEIRKEVFTEQFTPEEMVDFVFFNLVALVVRNNPSCDFLLEIIQRLLY